MCEYNKFVDKGVCNKGFIWNPSNYECGCDKSCDIREYLDYSNYKCRKKIIDELVEECTESIEETRPIQTSAKNKHKWSSCTIYRVSFWIFFIFFIINVHEKTIY